MSPPPRAVPRSPLRTSNTQFPAGRRKGQQRAPQTHRAEGSDARGGRTRGRGEAAPLAFCPLPTRSAGLWAALRDPAGDGWEGLRASRQRPCSGRSGRAAAGGGGSGPSPAWGSRVHGTAGSWLRAESTLWPVFQRGSSAGPLLSVCSRATSAFRVPGGQK